VPYGRPQTSEILEPLDVDLAVCDLQLVARPARDQRGGRFFAVQRPAEPRYEHVQRVRRGFGRSRCPKQVNQAVGGNDAVSMQDEQCKERTLARRTDVEPLLASPHLDTAEQAVIKRRLLRHRTSLRLWTTAFRSS